MDSSNKLNFILGEFTVPTSKIEGFEWLKIINAALAICKPYLKYFPEFRPISEQLNYIDGYDRRETDEAIIEFSKGITQKTCCVKIDHLIFETEGELFGDGVRFGNGVRFVILQTLFLSREGKWINQDYKFERKVQHGLGYRSHHTGILEEAKICKFSLMKRDTLLGFLKEKYRSGKNPLGQLILDILYSLAAESGKERKRRLQQIEQVEEQLAGIRNRIEFL